MSRARREPMETPDYAAMMVRMVRAYGRRVGEADPVDLARMLQVRADFDAAIEAAVAGLRAAGYSWAEIAEGLGTTRQAACMKYRKPAERLAEPSDIGVA